jgi:dTDP-L-rhamnose 4-epimerase
MASRAVWPIGVPRGRIGRRPEEGSMAHILVTGGAGFIGSHLVDALLARGHRVRVYDSLEAQVHGPGQARPGYLNPAAELIAGEMTDRDRLRAALEGVEVVYHQAAAVGVAQSMYEIARYVEKNTLGVAVLLDILTNERAHLSVRRLITASSMSIYGEGQYRCATHGVVYPRLRPMEQVERGEWEVRCPACGRPVAPEATPEEKPLLPTSVYAITKRDHEELCLAVGWAIGLPTIALRYFGVYGPRQALGNPYTGVAAIFSTRLLNGNPPVVYEDGQQIRDLIHVSDIVQGNLLAMERTDVAHEVFNIGTGRTLTVLDVAKMLCQELNPSVSPVVSGQFRAGDIRHCYADIGKARRLLGYEPRVTFEQGVAELVNWVRGQQAEDSFEKAQAELRQRGLVG